MKSLQILAGAAFPFMLMLLPILSSCTDETTSATDTPSDSTYISACADSLLFHLYVANACMKTAYLDSTDWHWNQHKPDKTYVLPGEVVEFTVCPDDTIYFYHHIGDRFPEVHWWPPSHSGRQSGRSYDTIYVGCD